MVLLFSSGVLEWNWRMPGGCFASSPHQDTVVALATMRQAVRLYAAQHNDTLPTEPVRQLTECTDSAGKSGSSYGPYLRTRISPNALGTSADVEIVETMPGASRGSRGWIYALDTGEIRADVIGSLPDGTRFFDL